MNIREELIQQGASEAQMKSKTLKMVENIIAEATTEELKEIGANHIEKLISELRFLVKEADVKCRKLTHLVEQTNGMTPLTDEASQALNVYRNVLIATKEVFGDDLSGETQQAAIQAASYGMWRSITEEVKRWR